MQIIHLILQTSALETAKVFYTQQLGLALQEDQPTFFTVQAGASQLTFRHNSTPCCYHFAFNIPENQIVAAQLWLEAQNLATLGYQGQIPTDFPNWNAHALYFLDTVGNVVELIARHDLTNASDKPFGSHSLLEISEIGLPVPAVAPFYVALQTTIQVPVYSHISNMETFCAAGDAQGLFILVPLQRKWFPTEVVNGIFPTEIHIGGVGQGICYVEGLPYRIVGS